jgi:hypothetical protein
MIYKTTEDGFEVWTCCHSVFNNTVAHPALIEAAGAKPLNVRDGMGYTPIPNPNFIGRCDGCKQIIHLFFV